MQSQRLIRCLARFHYGLEMTHMLCSSTCCRGTIGLPLRGALHRLSYTTYSSPETDEKDNFKIREYGRKRFMKRDLKPDLIAKPGSDPDTFGDLEGARESFDDENWNEEDKAEEETHQFKPERESMKYYRDLIKQYIKERKLADAIDVLETRMLKDDRVKPTYEFFVLLIGECGRVGYEKKAFQLYKQLRDRALRITPAVYTSLFNACANSPYPDSALERATHLREVMSEKGYQPNKINYHAMIKAFGRCGDLQTAFEVVDEMISNKFFPNSETFNFLLQGCISDKDAGFRHALLVWRKMVEKRIKPDLYTYNLFLRCTRDCGLGDLAVAEELLQRLLHEGSAAVSVKEKRAVSLDEPKSSKDVTHDGDTRDDKSNQDQGSQQLNDTSDSLITINQGVTIQGRPNLIAPVPTLGNIVALSEIKDAKDRLILLGGYNGVIETMTAAGVEPNIITFTQLLDIIPSTLKAEKEFLKTVKKSGVVFDIDFFNMLIKKRSFRHDYFNAHKVLDLIYEAKLHPDIITFGVLALSCETKEQAEELMRNIYDAGYRLNIEILGAMLKCAITKKDFMYVMEIMEQICRECIKPDVQFMSDLENFDKECRQMLDLPEKTEEGRRERKEFRNRYRFFRNTYKKWLKDVKPEGKVRPWDQFKKSAY